MLEEHRQEGLEGLVEAQAVSQGVRRLGFQEEVVPQEVDHVSTVDSLMMGMELTLFH